MSGLRKNLDAQAEELLLEAASLLRSPSGWSEGDHVTRPLSVDDSHNQIISMTRSIFMGVSGGSKFSGVVDRNGADLPAGSSL